MELRPHHLLCMQGYRGKGYDSEFVNNMDRVTAFLSENPDYRIRIKEGCDVLCSECPNMTEEGKCTTQDFVSFLDRSVTECLGIKEGEYSYGDAADQINRRLTKEVYYNICGSCQWFRNGICSIKERFCEM